MMEAGQSCDDEAAGDVEDTAEAVREVGHGEDRDPDAEELGDRVRVEEERGVRPAHAGRARDAGVVQGARHQLTPVDHTLRVVPPEIRSR